MKAFVVILCATLAGCASVPPWDRGNLAKPQMAFDLNPARKRAACARLQQS